MGHKKCWICGAGEFSARLFKPEENDLVVAADGGLAYLEKLNVAPNHILGDFDSLGYAPEGENVQAYLPEKDDTDMLLAVKYGIKNGCDTFLLYGGLGGRLSHTVANLQVLYQLSEEGYHGILVGETSIVTMIHNEKLMFDSACSGMLSVFSQGGLAKGVTIRNLKYTVENVLLKENYPIGVSNEFIGEMAEISVKDGTLLIIWENDQSNFANMHFSALAG